MCTVNPQILIVICCIHLHTHHMSRIPFLIVSFLDFIVFVVTTLIFHQNQRKCAISSTNVAILLLLFKRAIVAPNKLIDSQHYKRHKETTKIEFHSPLHFNFKLLQNDPDTGRISSQPPLISFKRDNNIGKFLVRSVFQTSD